MHMRAKEQAKYAVLSFCSFFFFVPGTAMYSKTSKKAGCTGCSTSIFLSANSVLYMPVQERAAPGAAHLSFPTNNLMHMRAIEQAKYAVLIFCSFFFFVPGTLMYSKMYWPVEKLAVQGTA
jgi:hypothetical protein